MLLKQLSTPKLFNFFLEMYKCVLVILIFKSWDAGLVEEVHGRDGEGKSQCSQVVELSLVQLIVHLTADQRIIYVLYEVNFV